MRLYAYGGNGHVERARVGKWPGFIESVLGSKDDVGASDSFGVGLVNHQELHLIYRTHVPDKRDGYAFTLLLGPSEAAWQLFEWNASRLLDALLAAGGARLMNPDDLDDVELKQIEAQARGRFTGPAPPVPAPAQQSWHAACVGAALSASQLVASSQEVGLADMPDRARMAWIVTQQAACFRIGNGWMIGGTPDMAETLGAGFLLANSARKSQPAKSVIERGRLFLKEWNKLPPDKRQADERKPIHLWRDLASLEQALGATGNGDSLPAEVSSDHPLVNDLLSNKEATLRQQICNSQTLATAPTRWLLSRLAMSQKPKLLSSEEVDALDATALREFLGGQKVPPAPAPQFLQLSPVRASSLAKLYLSDLRVFKVSDFTACCNFLKPYGVDEIATLETEFKKVVDTGSASLGDLAQEVKMLASPERERVGKLLGRLLFQQMQNTAKSPAWLRNAILMGAWSEESSKQLPGLPDWEAEVLQLNNQYGSSVEIDRWLDHLASDPVLRPALSLSAKRSLAKDNDVWKPFRTVDSLLQGSGDPAGKAQAPLHERAWLLAEVTQIIERQNWRGVRTLPQLEALHTYLTLPTRTVRSLDKRIRGNVGFFKRFFWSRTVAQFPFSEDRRSLDKAAQAVAKAEDSLRSLVEAMVTQAAQSHTLESIGLWVAEEEPPVVLAFLLEADRAGTLKPLINAMSLSGAWAARWETLIVKEDPDSTLLVQYIRQNGLEPDSTPTSLEARLPKATAAANKKQGENKR